MSNEIMNWGECTPESSTDALAKTICAICKEHTKCQGNVCRMAYVEAENLEKAGYRIPEPRKLLTATWEPKQFEQVTIKTGFITAQKYCKPRTWECSNCKYETSILENQNYCPKCGAFMDMFSSFCASMRGGSI